MKAMKWFLTLSILVVLAGCQKEEFSETENAPESSILSDAQLASLVRSVTSHDGSFDNRIDNSDCFSLKFPYGLLVNGVEHNMNSVDDFSEITPGAQVEPLFPITLKMSNYSEVNISSVNEYYDYIIGCHSGEFFDQVITCVDFKYPINLSMYDSGNSDFETVTLLHDWDVYSTIQELPQSMLVTIQYPISLMNEDGETFEISSNQQLKNEILRIVAFCN